ncbi:hypothetical protein OAO01_09075 [Oligoflexia bacterium]|nr:hypothetical protein [Oligoflexia bacterium]
MNSFCSDAFKLFAVVGDPIMHSKSPQMHNAAFKAHDYPAAYTRLGAKDAEGALATIKAMGICGINITSPYKAELGLKADQLSPAASQLSAVNTVVYSEQGSFGDTTDPCGVAGTLLAEQLDLNGKHVVVLGAGGAARAAISALLALGAKVHVINRTVERVAKLTPIFDFTFSAFTDSNLEEVLKRATLIVSCVSTPDRLFPATLLHKEHVVFDANYARPSALVQDAQSVGATVLDGRNWLLYQGIKAFELFTGLEAPHVVMQRAVFDTPPAQQRKSIALIGFMGSGKSTVARALGKLMQVEVIELDEQIEAEAGCSIDDIFNNDGEDAFRDLECKILQRFPARQDCILSCGGGVVLDQNNRHLLKERCNVVWLWASAAEVLSRVEGDSTRPLLRGKSVADVEQLIKKRIPYYAQTADLVLGTEGWAANEIASKILGELSI